MTIYPTYLYIKQHSVTGLKYFGKTTKDPLKYKGSGKHWMRHYRKHGPEYVINLWISEPYIDSIAISKYALSFSKENNIVESEDWANQKPENGLDGGVPGIPRGPSPRKGIPSGRKGIPSGRKGIPTGPSPRKGIPTGPSSRKGRPSPRKGIPTGPTGPRGKQQNPHGPTGPRGPYGKQQNPSKTPSIRKGIPSKQVVCPHCGKIGGNSGMKRYHFDNCKKKLLPL
jgi:hypothetical protein